MASSHRPKFRPGQVWLCKGADLKPGPRIIILQIDDVQPHGWIVHIAVSRIEGISEIEHLPICDMALEQSVTELISEDVPIPDYQEGYECWKDARGGAYSVTLEEVIGFIRAETSRSQ
jgi:hypothetical protein